MISLMRLDGDVAFDHYRDAFSVVIYFVDYHSLKHPIVTIHYDCEIRYYPGKANMVADALSRKERVKPKRVRDMNVIFQSSIKDRILAAQNEAMDESVGLQKSLDE
ncbi:hypothetical protein Tco_1498074, partial [Tanacetum coccineum]